MQNQDKTNPSLGLDLASVHLVLQQVSQVLQQVSQVLQLRNASYLICKYTDVDNRKQQIFIMFYDDWCHLYCFSL